MDDDGVRALAEREGVPAIAEELLTPVIDALIEIGPCMRSLNDLWTTTPLPNILLTTVGIAIAHANYRRVTGVAAPLSIWISEEATGTS